MANRLDFIFGSCRGIMLEWIHPYINVSATRVLVTKPRLKFRAGGLLGAGDALYGLAEIAIERKDSDSASWLERLEDVFRRWNGFGLVHCRSL